MGKGEWLVAERAEGPLRLRRIFNARPAVGNARDKARLGSTDGSNPFGLRGGQESVSCRGNWSETRPRMRGVPPAFAVASPKSGGHRGLIVSFPGRRKYGGDLAGRRTILRPTTLRLTPSAVRLV
jgi:hypothetical protein